MADAAFHQAREATDPDDRAQCLGLALGWHAMALQLEAHLTHVTHLEASQARLRTIAKEMKPPQ
jgi:hypothetical protein